MLHEFFDASIAYLRCSSNINYSFGYIITALKVEKTEGGSVDYNSMRVKQLKTLLDQRGVRCSGCTEKSEFVKRCQETENLDL
jgi:ARMET, C-terminal